MSVQELSRFIEKNIIKVLKKDMRPYLDAAIQRIEINFKGIKSSRDESC